MATTFDKSLRKCLAVGSIIVGSCAVGIPDPAWSRFGMMLATGMNAASLYMLKENSQTVASPKASS